MKEQDLVANVSDDYDPDVYINLLLARLAQTCDFPVLRYKGRGRLFEINFSICPGALQHRY